MEFCQSNRFLSIVRDSIKLVARNRKLIALIVFLSVFLNLIFVLLFAHSVQTLVHNMNASFRSYSLSSRRGFGPNKRAHLLHKLREDVAFLFALEVAFILAFSTISFFSTVATILISTVSYNRKNSSPKELFSMFKRSLVRPFITNFYTSGLSTAYFVFVFLFVAPLWIYPNLSISVLGISIMILSFVFYFYLIVPWIMAIVVSAAEESSYGLEALGRASALVKGKRLHGFLLNAIHGVSFTIVFQFYRVKMGEKEVATVALMIVMSVSSMVKMVLFVPYTIFYFQCKMHHGEEIESYASAIYKVAHFNLALVYQICNFILLFNIIFLFNSFVSTVSIILVSSVLYNSKISSLKELISMIGRLWRRPLASSMYLSTHTIDYFANIAIFSCPLCMYLNFRK